jgi:glutamate-1-semialdehyde 2,1-aminomutase
VCRDAQGQPSDAYRTLMMQEMIGRGVLFQGIFYPTWSHREAEIGDIADAFEQACDVYRQAVERGSCEGLLVGRPAKPVFRKTI